MDFSTIFGIIIGIGFILFGIMMGGKVGNFYDMPSIFITIGGTVAALLIHYPLKKIFMIPGIFKQIFFTSKEDTRAAVDKIVELSYIARREGLLALEQASVEIEDSFFQKGILLVVDGADPELIRSILETELSFLEDRHKKGQGILESAASYAPAFGMLGTLIGLINMLKNLSEPDKLGPSMAIALVTTFYGSFLANFLFTPMAGKLKVRSEQEIQYKEILLEGILSIQAGENPHLIEQKLMAFIAPPLRKKSDSAPEEEYHAQAE